MNAIHINGVHKTFRNKSGQAFKALDDVSLEIKEGEIFGLLGPNGAGKTTLISILAGLSRADQGRILVHGFDVQSAFRQARQLLGVVPQELVFDPFFTVREALVFQSGYYGIAKNDQWIDELLDRLQLSHKAHTNMRRLSGGMKRRVMVAQALVHKPRVIVLDEPTAGVDVALRQSLWTFVRELNHQGHTIVLTTHYLEEAQNLCARIAMLKAGKIIALDATHNFIARLANTELQLETENQEYPQNPPPDSIVAGVACYHIANYNDVEPILARIRDAGLRLKRMSVQETDLEDVFLQLMKS